MARVPIVRIDDLLIVSVQEDLVDQEALTLQADLSGVLERSGARGVLIDLSATEMIDSFLGRLLNDIAMGARLLGATTVVVGMRPAVAVTLVELGLELKGVRTALDMARGTAMLRREAAQDGNGDGRYSHL